MAVGVIVGVSEAVGVGVTVGEGVGVAVAVSVAVDDGVTVGVVVAVAVWVLVKVAVALGDNVAVAVDVWVGDAVRVADAVGLGDTVLVGVTVSVLVVVAVTVDVVVGDSASVGVVALAAFAPGTLGLSAVVVAELDSGVSSVVVVALFGLAVAVIIVGIVFDAVWVGVNAVVGTWVALATTDGGVAVFVADVVALGVPVGISSGSGVESDIAVALVGNVVAVVRANAVAVLYCDTRAARVWRCNASCVSVCWICRSGVGEARTATVATTPLLLSFKLSTFWITLRFMNKKPASNKVTIANNTTDIPTCGLGANP